MFPINKKKRHAVKHSKVSLKSDQGLQVERTTLSWFRTLFLSCLVTLAAIKVAIESHTLPLYLVTFLLLYYCVFLYLSSKNVDKLRSVVKSYFYQNIAWGLGLSAMIYLIELITRF